MKLLLVYLLIINAIGFVLMLADKYSAQNKMRRIPEATLIGVAVIGGSLGTWAGMFAVRHKTRHLKFMLGIPVILAVQVVFGYLAVSLLQYRKLPC